MRTGADFKKPNDGHMLGAIDLSGCEAVRADGLTGKQFVMRVRGAALVKEFDFLCESEAVVEGFLKAVQAAIVEANAKGVDFLRRTKHRQCRKHN